jgi:hypothetical protein
LCLETKTLVRLQVSKCSGEAVASVNVCVNVDVDVDGAVSDSR